MAFDQQYKTLFDVLIYHHYFLDNGTTDFESMSDEEQEAQLKRYNLADCISVIPSKRSAQTLKNHKLIFKNRSAGFKVVTLVDAENTNKPAIDVSDMELTFYLMRNDAFFDNYSLLALEKDFYQHYYFSNRNGSSGAAFPALNHPVPAFNTGNDYSMGDLVLSSGNLYEALENINNATTNPNAGSSGWRNITNRAYTNNDDIKDFYWGWLPFHLETADIDFTAVIKDKNDNEIATMESDTSNEKHDFSLDISSIPEGIHTLVVSNNADDSELLTQEFFCLKEEKPANLLGVVHILGSPGTAAYSLTDGSGELLSPQFEVRFRNRSTYWRYIDHTDRSVLLETDIQPFTKRGFISVVLDGDELPNPDIRIIKPETDKIFTEVYM